MIKEVIVLFNALKLLVHPPQDVRWLVLERKGGFQPTLSASILYSSTLGRSHYSTQQMRGDEKDSFQVEALVHLPTIYIDAQCSLQLL